MKVGYAGKNRHLIKNTSVDKLPCRKSLLGIFGMMEWSYFFMLGFLLTHELDAVLRHEWRVLPLTSFLPDHLGQRVFIWAHVPLIAGLFGLGGQNPNSTTALWISAFAIVHVFLHILFRNHPKYEFNNFGSWALILGAGMFGAIHLVLKNS